MNNQYQDKRKKSYVQLRTVYDFTMGAFILAMGFILFFGDRFGLDLIATLEPAMRYGFGSLCLLYGSFRVYRGIKHDY